MSNRTCLKKRRRQEDAPVSQPLPVPTLPVCTLRGPWLLARNYFFWAEYRHGGRPPVEINFLGLPAAPAAQPVMEQHEAEQQVNDDGDGEEVDLTLKL
ncbi:hypothetical protein ZWY2020_022011 [Hordeum vulgare]|nr:hypothetical protein ZWY2020_022011 [Hordeum vulgare]